MKNNILAKITVVCFFLATCFSISAQGIMVYTKDGKFVTYSYSDLDSIVTFDAAEEIPVVPFEKGTVGSLVDLGLSVDWASWNVGASSEDGLGHYFAWADTTWKHSCTLVNYMHFKDANKDGVLQDGEMTELGDVKETKLDVARVEWGGEWRMPTKAEIAELIDSCEWTWTSIGDVQGWRVARNGKNIFLPAAGYRDGAEVYEENEAGNYMASTLSADAMMADIMRFTADTCACDSNYRYYGFVVRPVATKLNITIAKEVDLGLPSGTIWAGWNVGASAPQEYGNHYAWGEVETKDDYMRETYKFYDAATDSYSTPANGIIGDPEYDAATKEWGAEWQIPTDAQMQELIDNCEWRWYTFNDKNGYVVTGPNENAIFLPASGLRAKGSKISFDGTCGYYSTGTLHSDYFTRALEAQETSIKVTNSNYRLYGYTIRPVKVKLVE